MVDDFMVCVDRIIVSTCFESVHRGNRDSERPSAFNNIEPTTAGSVTVTLVKKGECSSNMASEIVECRVCHEEEDVHSMEAPCACNGTIKFAHRRCIQRWCNKKGDITCEICNQVFSPSYSIPPAKSNDVMAIDIRQWGPHLDLRDSDLLALAAAERHLLQSEYEDYTDANSGGITCMCSIAVIILLVVLLIRQALMITRLAGVIQPQESSAFNVSLLQIAGLLLPCYVMARSWLIIQSRRRRRQV